ncbi:MULTISPECIES: ABC transporter substrate-binding protein [Acetobacter]|uniref:ABC transporter substrate-binding protein n=1 Tax=Acetobacter thailandicus TaxID=1502842 RepID=A0ABT3QGZ5_9PROT|nr:MULTISPECIES: ABC transporter substrate-binding protein [Acetobacter]MBS0961327.1 ABC transporter substrate-binding protein [Acetobacter thailandicus]MBS0980078.1 ABC transporter substrate-binding protein [Acetobacter thailandicus]MBS0986260.1 ABC transporter substrate-binding protein [Acetobacter thailandicus]MBS1003034.1 ABC transporter substrate-binding protein [Acetobacter thailandicus]MCX2564553.1 ABC transporter substrate-binding protein [Acetobacter thailandicus]
MSLKRIAFRAGLLLGLGVAFAPVAGSGLLFPAAQAQTAANSAVITPVQTLYAALEQIQTSHAGFSDRAAIVGAAVDKSFDLSAVLKASVGLRYDSLTPEDKAKLLAAFRDFTVARYVSSFTPGAGARFTIKPEPENSPVAGDKIVNTFIGSQDSMPGTPLSYIMHHEDNGWRITDVLLSESRISQAAAQRSDFRSTLTSGGVAGLIKVLENKVKSFSEAK